MKTIRWKQDIINLDGLRNIEYSSTNHKVTFYFQNESKTVIVYANEKELEELYQRIFKATDK